MGPLDEVARRVVKQGVAPAAAVACARRKGASWALDAGGAVETYFDLASVTKPMTAVAVLAQGIASSSLLGSLLPEVQGTASENVTMGQLLSHRAGLLGHRPIYEPLLRGELVDCGSALRIAAGARRPELLGSPGPFEPLYSDLGYVLAGAALAKASSSIDAGAAIETLVVRPLGMTATLGTIRSLRAHGIDVVQAVAETEVVPWRGGTVRAAVHDENAWAIGGEGGCGHAGIFGTAMAVLGFGCAVLDALDGLREPFGPIDLRPLVEEQPGGTLRAGFDGKSNEGSSAGGLFGPRSFGHLGFTGTSLWVDPDAKVVAVFLSNRVSPSRANVLIRTARPEVNDALFAYAERL